LTIAATGAWVIAVDVSPAMVATIQRKAGQAGLDNIQVVEAGFLTYQHNREPADFVYTRNALHQLPDFWKVVALDRISRMMRPGGYLLMRDLVFDLEPKGIDEGIEAWMGGAVDDPARGFTAAELADHVRNEYSTFTWLLEPMLERCGFEVVERSSRRSAYGMYLCRKG
jgi:SAM-dependent methyltransferase